MVLGNQLSSVICTSFLPLDAVYAFSNVSGCLREVRFAGWLNMDSCTFSSSTYGTKLTSKSLKGTPLSYNATHKPDLHFPLYQIFAFYNLSNLQIRTLPQGNIKQQVKTLTGLAPTRLQKMRSDAVCEQHTLVKLQVELEAVKKTGKNYRVCSVKINSNYRKCLLKQCSVFIRLQSKILLYFF